MMPSVANLVERFVDNRRRRQQAIDAHLDEVEDALAQGDPVKFAFWSLDQDATFFADGGPAPRMLEVLGREIGLTAEQMGKLNAHRPAIRHDRETLARCQAHMRQVRADIHAHIRRSGDVMEQIRKILSPVQVAKFFVWVEKHQHSVKTLTTLWDGTVQDDDGEDGREEGEEEGEKEDEGESEENDTAEGPSATLADAADEGADQGEAKRAKRKHDARHDARSSEVAGDDESGGGDVAGVSGSRSIDYARQAVGLASLLAPPDWPAGAVKRECTALTLLGGQKQQQVSTSSDAGRFTPASAAKPAVKREPAPPRAPSARARLESNPKTDMITSEVLESVALGGDRTPYLVRGSR